MTKPVFFFFFVFYFFLAAIVNAKPILKSFLFGESKLNNAVLNVDTTTKYSSSSTYGLTTFGPLTSSEKGAKIPFVASKLPFYFSVQLPEGHYRVLLTLGGSALGSSTTLKAESRRLMFENLNTAPGKTITQTIIVDVRAARIDDSTTIKLKSRELKYLNWDNKLTLEFCGQHPCVSRIDIQRADDLPTIFLAGNSTVTDQEYEPWASWGQMFTNFVKPNVVVANFAESGETLLAFKRENRLKKILSLMKKGDYLFLEFAHNDQKQGANHLDPFTTYKDELKLFIAETKKKGGIPVLVTSTNRRRFDENGKIINTLDNYPLAMRQIAAQENVVLIDLNAMSKDLFEALGAERSKKAFVHYPANSFPGQLQALADDTHFNPYGAYQLARCIVASITKQKLNLTKFLKNNIPVYNPKLPDAETDFRWYESPSVDLIKPDGN